MIDINEIELHDALIKSVTFDCIERIVKLNLDYYPNGSSCREPVSFLFSGVDLISQVMSMEKLSTNAFAGNVNYWIPEENGLTYIYLTDGCIMIKAERISLAA